MNKNLLIVSLLALNVMPAFAHAQNVLLPKDATTTAPTLPAVTAPTVAPKAAILPSVNNAPATTPTRNLPYSVPAGIQNQASGQSGYISAEQQKNLIAMENQNLVSYQKSLAEMQHLQTTQPAVPKSQQDQQIQSGLQDTVVQLSTGIKQSQDRLAVLQAGPVKLVDLMALYQTK